MAAAAAALSSTPLPGVLLAEHPSPNGLGSEFATEILPAPPSLLSIQQALVRKEAHAKKPLVALSHLPSSDPGSTYTGAAGSLAGPTDDGGRSRKRQRFDKGLLNGVAQRISSRNSVPPSSVPGQNSRVASLEPKTRRSNGQSDAAFSAQIPFLAPSSSQSQTALPEDTSDAGRARSASMKGKSRLLLTLPIDVVKMEPSESPLSGQCDMPGHAMDNEDHCSACRSIGSLLYCDSCPRAFHLWCLNPPMEHSDLPGEDASWYCPACSPTYPPPEPSMSSFMSGLIFAVQTSLPAEFSLPEDIRSYFKHVGTGPRGTYKDTSIVRPLRLNRLGLPEEREPHRLKDKNGASLLCFRCGRSSLPAVHPTPDRRTTDVQNRRPRRATANQVHYGLDAYEPEHRSMLSCDYCSLSWHLDCLSPPLTSMPSLSKKWMCPNHAQQTLKNRRIPKSPLSPVEVRTSGVTNHGNIDIIPSNDTHLRNTVPVDEVLINGRIFRVPERIIILDFWNKLRSKDHPQLDDTGIISPLSPLSSLEEDEPTNGTLLHSHNSSAARSDPEALSIAEVLCGLSRSQPYWLSRQSWVSGTESDEDMTLPASSSRQLSKRNTADEISSGAPSLSLPAPGELPALSRRSFSSELSPCTTSSLESDDEERPEAPTPSLKIRIPRPLNIAVATASAAAAKQPPVRQTRRTRNTIL